jgi:hypothetical protein
MASALAGRERRDCGTGGTGGAAEWQRRSLRKHVDIDSDRAVSEDFDFTPGRSLPLDSPGWHAAHRPDVWCSSIYCGES